MRKIISFMHISLDGFVSGPDGEMDWFNVNEEIFDYVGIRITQGDTALYGRVTYQMMENYWPDAGTRPGASKHDIEHSGWYNSIHKLVLSGTLHEESLKRTSIISDRVLEKLMEIKQQEGKEILIFGSPTATHSLLKLGFIDGYWLFVNPVILGQGVPLFVDIKEKTKLRLLSSRTFACGVTELNYLKE
jgi:dihydrofolate reductase